jgi:DNA-binding NtrC family response regulator
MVSKMADSSSTPKPQARLLVVDDKKDIATTIMDGMTKHGIMVDVFTKPSLALEHFLQHSTDYCVVVSDVRMPGMSGFQLVREVGKVNSDVKIILMSSFDIHTYELHKVLPNTRVGGFILKPFSVNKLRKIVLELIGETKSTFNST